MEVAEVVLGCAPTTMFSVLAPRRGAGWVAGVGLLVAVAVTIATSRGKANTLFVALAVVLLAMAVSGLAGGPDVDQALMTFGPSVTGLLLGVFTIATATCLPFTAQIARQLQPPGRPFRTLHHRYADPGGAGPTPARPAARLRRRRHRPRDHDNTR